MSGWAGLTDGKKFELLRRRYVLRDDVGTLAAEVGMNSVTLNRNLQRLRAALDESQPDWRDQAVGVVEPVIEKPVQAAKQIEFPPEKPLPTNSELFDLLRKGPISLGELSRKFDRSEATVMSLIERMEKAGYVVQRTNRQVSINTQEHPHVDYAPARTLADEVGHEIVFAVASDLHAGSTHSQPSAHARFIQIAYEEYGARHIFDPGDKTTGVGGYRGQDIDIIEPIRPRNGKDFANTTEGQIWLADAYTPKMPGLRYYQIGGNHDYWHVMNTGIDAVSQLCRSRDDMVYLGYDVADVPLTDRVSIRLWHPSGGVPYSVSYRLQKGMEQLAFEELTRAIEENGNPKVRFLLAGHLHVEVKLHRGPMVAAHVGCFEGTTNYLKRKGLYPQIGGSIFKVRVTDAGMIQRVEYTFVPFTEVEEDWKNWPTPPRTELGFEPDRVEALFQIY